MCKGIDEKSQEWVMVEAGIVVDAVMRHPDVSGITLLAAGSAAKDAPHLRSCLF